MDERTNKVGNETKSFQVQSAELNKLRLRQNKKGVRDHLRWFCFQNDTSSFILVLVVLILKLAMTVLYVVRLVNDEVGDCENCTQPEALAYEAINWDAIWWIKKSELIWAIEVGISIYTWLRMLCVTYLRFRGSILKMFTLNLCLETAMSLPVILTLCWEPLRHIYLPTFLNCWLAKRMLDQNVLSHRRMRSLSLFTQKVVAVVTTLLCLVFTGACGVQQIQRGSRNNLTIFEAFYFVMVTLSTVGYGDFSPDIWPSRLFVVILIIIAVITIPNQVESLASSWVERQRRGGRYSKSAKSDDKHVVFCCTILTPDILEEFLNEFFSHRHLQDYYVIFMSASEMDAPARRVIQSPLWLHRCMFICGSCLKDEDLARAGVKEAEAFFLLGERSMTDRATSDQHTILRAWAVKDYAPKVHQLVQLFQPQNRVHVKFSKHTVVGDELKYSMLAYNCLVPATSTLLTLLLHTSKGEEGATCVDPWLKLYGRHSGNELYGIKLIDSLIFSPFVNVNFTTASIQAHERFGVLLIGVQFGDGPETILINPGPQYTLKVSDMCFYLSITKEEDMDFKPQRRKPSKVTGQLKRLNSFPPNPLLFTQPIRPQHTNSLEHVRKDVTVIVTEESRSIDNRWVTDSERCEIRIGCLPLVPYVGMAKVLCYLRKEKKQPCCLSLGKSCKHSSYNSVKDYNFAKKIVILVADQVNYGFFHFISTLRAYYLPLKHLKPIVLLLKEKPSSHFLDVFGWFPMVYWIQGSFHDTDDIIAAGINIAEHVVVVGKETSADSNSDGATDNVEGSLSDCGHIVTIQMLKQYFPSVKFTTELLQSSNMRFMQFQAMDNECSTHLAEVEKNEKEQGSSLAYIFRAPFASGSVFTTNMLDSMLYQGYVKNYLSPLVRTLLGITQNPRSGFLTSITMDKMTKNADLTFGEMFSTLSLSGGDVPIAIYRTQRFDGENAKRVLERPDSNSADITNLIKNRMRSMGLAHDEYEHLRDQGDAVSYLIINPRAELQLQHDDVILVLRICPNRPPPRRTTST